MTDFDLEMPAKVTSIKQNAIFLTEPVICTLTMLYTGHKADVTELLKNTESTVNSKTPQTPKITSVFEFRHRHVM